MEKGSELLDLAAWRRQTAEIYARARDFSAARPEAAWEEFRRSRSAMFRTHPQSPLGQGARESFRELAYFPYAPRWRFTATVKPLGAQPGKRRVAVDLPEGRLSLRPFGVVHVGSSTLTLFWVEAYGGGVFLPFRDATNGKETYAGGRYLYDTIKGADLGAGPGDVVLDFNYAYNPSCAYDPRWVCPLAPAENILAVRVEAGELAFLPA